MEDGHRAGRDRFLDIVEDKAPRRKALILAAHDLFNAAMGDHGVVKAAALKAMLETARAGLIAAGPTRVNSMQMIGFLLQELNAEHENGSAANEADVWEKLVLVLERIVEEKRWERQP